jgi:hypothetical protein
VFYGAGTNSVRGAGSSWIRISDLTFPPSRLAGNLVLQGTIERLYVANLYADVPRGIFLVRGENVSLLGEIVWKPSRLCPTSFFAYG